MIEIKMRLIYTRHASQRLERRKIPADQVYLAVSAPDIADYAFGAVKKVKKFVFLAGRREALVVIFKVISKDIVLIITTYYED